MVIGDIGGLVDRAWGLAWLFRREVMNAFSQQTLALNVIEITKANIGTTFQTLLYETSTNSVGASYIMKG